MDIEDIPFEVLQLIIEYVRYTGTRADLGRLSCASRKLANLVPVPLHFLVHFNSNFGEIVYVVGNIPELGSWKVIESNRMEWRSGGWWSLTRHVIEGSAIEYKYVMVDHYGNKHWWEKEGNHHQQLVAPPAPLSLGASTESWPTVSPPTTPLSPTRSSSDGPDTLRSSANGSSDYSAAPNTTANSARRKKKKRAAPAQATYRQAFVANKVHAEEVPVLYNCRGRFLLSADYDIKGHSYDLTQSFMLAPRHPARVRVMTATHGGQVLFSADDNALLRTTDLATLQIINDMALERWILDLWINKSDNLLYMLTNWEVKIFDRRSYRIVQRIPGDYELRDTSSNSAFAMDGDFNIFVGSKLRQNESPFVTGTHKTVRHYDLRHSGACVRAIESERSIKQFAKASDGSGEVFATTWWRDKDEENYLEVFETGKFSLQPIGETGEVVTSLKLAPEGQLLWGSDKGVSILFPQCGGQLAQLTGGHKSPITSLEVFGDAVYSGSGALGRDEATIVKWIPHPKKPRDYGPNAKGPLSPSNERRYLSPRENPSSPPRQPLL